MNVSEVIMRKYKPSVAPGQAWEQDWGTYYIIILKLCLKNREYFQKCNKADSVLYFYYLTHYMYW